MELDIVTNIIHQAQKTDPCGMLGKGHLKARGEF